jgi:hypothetical protein
VKITIQTMSTKVEAHRFDVDRVHTGEHRSATQPETSPAAISSPARARNYGRKRADTRAESRLDLEGVHETE